MGYSTQTHFFYYRDIIYNLYQDMCTYSQLKKKLKIMCNPPPPPPPSSLCPKSVRV